MIKFFRRIRQNLINEGKTARYLKYAIGEIVLVVIGILIALQINNWNDQRKAAIVDEALRKEYIRDLYREMQNIIYQLDGSIDIFKQNLEGAEYLLKSIENDSLKIENTQSLQDAQSKILSRSITDQTRTYDVNQNTTFQEMRLSGKLTLVKDDTLFAMLDYFYSDRKLKDNLFQQLETTRDEFGNFIFKSSPLIEKTNLFENGAYSFNFIKTLFNQAEYYEPVRKIYSISNVGKRVHVILKDSAQAVMDFMEKHYSDILKNSNR